MKTSVYSLFLATLIILGACSGKDDEPEMDSAFGTLTFDTTGTYTFSLDVQDLTATITIIGGGGGGGGGVHHNNSVSNSTGGGGGGGAGEVIQLQNVSLETGVEYTVVVGSGGKGGIVGFGGVKGTTSSFGKGAIIQNSASGGTGGLSNTTESMTGGKGGAGFPNGSDGGDGEVSGGITPEALPGTGGAGGVNTSLFGAGGGGGKGAEVKNGIALDAESGTDGKHGYVQIEWKGKR